MGWMIWVAVGLIGIVLLIVAIGFAAMWWIGRRMKDSPPPSSRKAERDATDQ